MSVCLSCCAGGGAAAAAGEGQAAGGEEEAVVPFRAGGAAWEPGMAVLQEQVSQHWRTLHKRLRVRLTAPCLLTDWPTGRPSGGAS